MGWGDDVASLSTGCVPLFLSWCASLSEKEGMLAETRRFTWLPGRLVSVPVLRLLPAQE
jgi:hypothetical protein